MADSAAIPNLLALTPPRDEFVGPKLPSPVAGESGTIADSIFAAIRGGADAVGAFGAAIPQPWQDALLSRIAKGTAANKAPTVQATTAEEILRTQGVTPNSLGKALAVSPTLQIALYGALAFGALLLLRKALR